MHDHAEILALAAAAIDFELDPAERSQLEAALAACPLCRRRAGAMRASATILRRSSDIGTPSRVRDVVIRTALDSASRTAGLRLRLAVGLSLTVVLGTAAVLVGSGGIELAPPVPPTGSLPTQELASPAISTASPAPSEARPSASAETPQPSSSPSPDANAPLRAGEIAAMVTDGRLVIRTQPGMSADSAIFKTRIYPGQRILTLEGPVEASGYPWFRVRLGVIEGWVAAVSRDGAPWLAPVRNGAIAFVRDAADGSGEAIYTIGPDGTDETLLLADPGLVHYEQLTWSPDGRRLAFVGQLAGAVAGSAEIFVVDADGSNLVELTQNAVLDDNPAWSPDSTRIAFRRADPDSQVFVMGADGSSVRPLGPGGNPVWSPDGLGLALTVPDGGSQYLWVQAADGSDRRRVSEIPSADERPAWSPDGLRLVFAHAAADAGHACGLCVVEVSSGSTTPLTVEDGATPTRSIAGPIAFSTPGSSPGVFVVDPDGTGLRRVSGDLSGAIAPQWSPDGRRLLFTVQGNGSQMSVVDADGGGLTLVGQNNGTNRSPAWQPLLQ